MSQAPLVHRTGHWTQAADRQRTVNAFFDKSAGHYDRACGIMSFGSGGAYRRAALSRAGVRPGMSVLDVGTGTGLLAREAVELAGPRGLVIGVDPSRRMMAAGRNRGAGLVQGLGESLPFADGGFDVVTMGYALRHVPDLDQTFAEYARVLKPRGRVVLLEITKPVSALGSAVARAYFGTVVPCLVRIGTGSPDASDLMRFYWDTIAHCVSPELILAGLTRAGFVATRTVTSGIFSEYVGQANSKDV